MNASENGQNSKRPDGLLWLLLLILGAALAVLCREAFAPNEVMWANDGSLGEMSIASSRMPDGFFGHWADGWWLGMEVPAAGPSLGSLVWTLLSPAMFMKLFAPFTMLFLGFSAWLLFRQLKLAPLVCVLGGVAAGLNMHCFSVACWGLGMWNLSIAMVFLALTALLSDAIRPAWIKAALAGLVVGMGVVDGFDCGAILSIYVGVFVLFLCWTREAGVGRKITRSLLMGGLVVFFSAFVAASTVASLVGTQIQGIAGTGQSEKEKRDRWDFATIASLPKLETLRLVIPGLFGYRLENYDTTPDKAGVYWGKVSQNPLLGDLESSDANIRTTTAAALQLPDEDVRILAGNDSIARAEVVNEVARSGGVQRRHTGSAEYAGVLVTLLAVFALASSWRWRNQAFSAAERRLIWFCGAAALFSLVAAWGRHAFLYAWLYKLPYFSTIRNPIKFLHPFHLLWLILAGYGLEALHRSYLQNRADHAGEAASGKAAKEGRLSGFEKAWMGGLVLVAGAAGLGYLMYGAINNSLSRNLHQSLATYIFHQGFSNEASLRMASFAIGEAGWFALFLGLSSAAIVCILSGKCRGKNAEWAWLFLIAIMVFDLGRSDRPWVRYYDYKQTYAINPVLDFLRQHPHESRVAAKLSPNDPGYALCPGNYGVLGVVSHWWLENDFPFNEIESIDIDQMSRAPVLETNILATFAPRLGRDASETDLSAPFRLWRLANARYLLAPAAMVSFLNERADPVGHSFQIKRLFDLVPKKEGTQPADAGDLTAVLNENGPYAIIEITNALPRAKLYANWQTPNDDEATLQILNSAQFDPEQTVLVANSTPVPSVPVNPTADPGTVSLTDYQSKDIHLQATADTAAILLLNDRTDKSWHARVDGKPAPILLCNYIMRGVYLTPGEHTIEFRFQPPLGPFYVSCAAILVGLLLSGYLIYARFTQPEPPEPSAPTPAPAPVPVAKPLEKPKSSEKSKSRKA